MGLNEPHTADPHVAVQITPAAFGSLLTVTPKLAIPLISTEAGARLVNAIAIGTERMVRLALLLCEGLLVTVAVMVTVLPIGAMEGAV